MLEQPPHAVREPTTGENDRTPAGAAVLGGFPSHESAPDGAGRDCRPRTAAAHARARAFAPVPLLRLDSSGSLSCGRSSSPNRPSDRRPATLAVSIPGREMAHLLRDQVVELPYRESGRLPAVPRSSHSYPGACTSACISGEPVAECSSYSEGAALERKEADDLVALLQDRESLMPERRSLIAQTNSG
mgnify:CR=1 FL=1